MKRIWIVFALLFVGIGLLRAAQKFGFIEDKEKGTLTVIEGKERVLTYRFADQLKEGFPPEQTRSCYIHPLYSVDGQVLTDDFIVDHPHHHGVFWTWPVVETRGQVTQTWHPANLRQYFARWIERNPNNSPAVISVENEWKLENEEIVARERVTLNIYPAADSSRIIDVGLTIQAIGGPLKLQGAQDGGKGYGGLSFRGSKMFTGAAVTSDKGPIDTDINNAPFLWTDISTKMLGVAIFTAPDNPDFPSLWITRNSYAGFLNPSWPGLEAVVLNPEESISLRYRIYIHRGDAQSGKVSSAYQTYVQSYIRH